MGSRLNSVLLVTSPSRYLTADDDARIRRRQCPGGGPAAKVMNNERRAGGSQLLINDGKNKYRLARFQLWGIQGGVQVNRKLKG